MKSNSWDGRGTVIVSIWFTWLLNVFIVNIRSCDEMLWLGASNPMEESKFLAFHWQELICDDLSVPSR